MKYSNQGFTLVELTLVLVVLGILMGVGVTDLTARIENARIERTVAEARELANHAQRHITKPTESKLERDPVDPDVFQIPVMAVRTYTHLDDEPIAKMNEILGADYPTHSPFETAYRITAIPGEQAYVDVELPMRVSPDNTKVLHSSPSMTVLRVPSRTESRLSPASFTEQEAEMMFNHPGVED